jgi:hypothetical protein
MLIFSLLLVFATSCATACADDALGAIYEKWQKVGEPQRLYLAADPYTVDGKQPPASNPEKSKELSSLAREAASLGEGALALRLATEAVYWDRDNPEARGWLGYQQVGDQWLTPFQKRMHDRRLEWHPRYGWIEPSDGPRFDAGERKMGRRWVTAEIDAAQHQTITRGWQVRTDHFVVTTNHSLEAGAALAGELERLYQIWQQLFADYHLSATELRNRFESGQTPGVQSRPFKVIYHVTRDQYIAELSERQPRIGETLGIYFDQFREAHFYFVPGNDNRPTLYHEAVHQLFQESTRTVKSPGTRDNFWLLEGAALYFETLRHHDDPEEGVFYTIGEPDAGRLPVAIERLTKDGYYIPLANLVALGQRDLQQRDDLPRLYGQATGIATYFMATPERRKIFVDYLKAFYAGRTDPTTLSTLAGKTYPELDAEIRAFLSK